MPADNRRAVYEAQSPEMICEVVERIRQIILINPCGTAQEILAINALCKTYTDITPDPVALRTFEE
jgi:hypothetical protein